MYCVSITYRECLRDFVPTVPTAPFYRQDTRCRGGGGVCPSPRDGAVLGCLVSLADPGACSPAGLLESRARPT